MRIWIIAALLSLATLTFVSTKKSAIDQHIDSLTKNNLIFITVDTLRADHTPFSDYFRPTMPATQEFFHDALNFTQAQTVRTTTAPSYAAMLSGLYPYRTGVRNNFIQLNDQIDTLQEKLQRSGYRTAAFVSSFVMNARMSGFNQGFNVYDDYVLERELNRENYERTAGNTVKHVLSWLESVPSDRPFFLFLHFIDPHGPYHPPSPYRETFSSGKTRILKKHQIPDFLIINSVLDQYRYIDWYDGEILYLDTELRALYKKLKTFENNSWFLFVADHGESMGEHDRFFKHGSCYESETRVSMAWLPPVPLRKLYKPGRIGDPVSVVDVTPTSLELLQVSNKGKFDGESLVPAFRGKNLKNPYRFIERYWDKDLSYAVRNSKFKMIKNYWPVANHSFPSKFWRPEIWDERSVELYDLASDAAEERNLISTKAAPEDLGITLDKFIEDARGYRIPFTVTKFKVPHHEMAEYVREHADDKEKYLTDEEVEKLRALGYVDE